MSVIALDLGRSKAIACLVDEELQIEDELRRDTRGISDSGQLFELAAELAARHPQARAVGMSIAGDVDRAGCVHYLRAEAGVIGAALSTRRLQRGQ